MSPPPKPHASLSIAILVLLLLSSLPATAAGLLAGARAAVTEPAAKSEAAEIIPATEIPTRADADERFVQDVMSRARQQDATAGLAPKLTLLTTGVQKLAPVMRDEGVSRLPVVRLESLESHWNFYDRQLNSWRRDLQRVTSGYSEDAASVSARRAAWEATRAKTGLAPALASRASGIAAQLAVAERAISKPLDQQLQLGRKANTLQASIDAGRKAVSASINDYDKRLMTIDVPPLWAMASDPDYAQGDAISAAEMGISIEEEFLAEYVAAYRERLVVHAALALALLPLLLWLSVRSRKMVSDDPSLQSSAHVLRRPISAWLVVTLVSVPLLLPDAPLLLHQVALLLALIPVLRLLPANVYTALGAAPFIVTGLYLIYRLGFLLLGHALYFRIHLLAVSLIALVALVWLLWSRAARTLGPGMFAAGTWRGLGFLAVAVLMVAVAANVIGNVSLATVLTGGVVASFYVGLALQAGAAVLTSMLRLLLARKSITRFRVVSQRSGPLLEALGRLVKLGALVLWAAITLDAFRVLRPAVRMARKLLTFPLEAGHISVTLGAIMTFLLSVWIAFWLARSIRAVLQDDVLPNMSLPRGVSNTVSTLSYYALVTVGLLVALAAAGFETSQFTIIFGALGVGIGFGLQNVVNNFVSGLILMFERPIQPGDVVEVSGTQGRVRAIGMRATTLTTFDGADVIVPNGTLLSEKLINWTLSDMDRRLDVDVGVAYGSNPRRVMELLAETATSTPGISPEPPPSVVFLRFGVSSLDFGIRAWTSDFADWVSIRSELTIRVYDALRAEGIEIPFPQQGLHLRSVSPEAIAQLAASRVAPNTTEPG